jgi:hypothetical protein
LAEIGRIFTNQRQKERVEVKKGRLARRRLIPLLLLVGSSLGLLPLACGKDRVPSPFGPGAGGSVGEAGSPGSAGFKLDVDAGSEVDPTLGGPCQDDGQCDDGVSCTHDACDEEIGRCRFSPDDGMCDNPRYCDGLERCDVRDGCVFGEPVACSDNNTCTIDVCLEATQSCRNDPRDADGDGDPTHNCGGADCDDAQPLVHSGAGEVCGNHRDDDCDQEIDEDDDCVVPQYDTCAAPLAVNATGYYEVDLVGTALDYSSECTAPQKCITDTDCKSQGVCEDGNCTGEPAFRDTVLSIAVGEGGLFDVDVTAKLDSGRLALTTAATCGDPASVSCKPSYTAPAGGSVSRLLLRGLSAGEYPVYLAADSEATALVYVEIRPAEAHPGELCDQAVELTSEAALRLRLPAYTKDVASRCQSSGDSLEHPNRKLGDAFVWFELDEASDVVLIAESELSLGEPVLTLLEACQTELTCRNSQPARLFARNLAPGTYHVAVAATGPDDVSIRLETFPPSEAPPGEGCDDPQPLTLGVETLVDLSLHQDSINALCLAGAPDATFGFELDGKRDVALVGRSADSSAVSIANLDCSSAYACEAGAGTMRALRYGLEAGSYRGVIESYFGNPVGLSLFERPALPTVHVPFGDDCDSTVTIPELGGRFTGNTSNAFPDFSAGCDVGGQDEGGASDQILKLVLSESRRVIFDMQGSTYQTMLSVRRGPDCPGVELPSSCATGLTPGGGRSYLDLDLDAGEYVVQIDGYDGASGAWTLNVFTAPR